jgi:hypothetical protein
LLFGSAIHYILEKGSPDDALAEEKLMVEVVPAKIAITSRSDLYMGEEIQDYKVSKATSVFYADEDENEPQLNCYAWMYRKKGFPVKKLTVVKIFRDWDAFDKLRMGGEYPEIAIVKYPVKVWDEERLEGYIQSRITAHLTTPELTCNDKERWTKPDKFALMSAGRKTAIRVLDSEDEAKKYMADYAREFRSRASGLSIQVRKGGPLKCMGRFGKSFCVVSNFCPLWKKEKHLYVKGEESNEG